MKVDRVFVPEGTNPFDMFRYENYDYELRHGVTDEVLMRLGDCEVPAHWSKNAKDVLINKYFRKGGVPLEVSPKATTNMPQWLWPHTAKQGVKIGGEKSVKQVIHRMVSHWTYVGLKNGYFNATEEEVKAAITDTIVDDSKKTSVYVALRDVNAKAFYDENVYIMLNQMAAPNSPQWFNTGLWWAYGITGEPQGHFYVELPHRMSQIPEGFSKEGLFQGSKSVADSFLEQHTMPSPNAYERVQAHACFILRLEDNMCLENGILSWYEREGRIFKYGSGAGANVSNLRATGEPLSGGGKSSGSMSWIMVADRSAGSIKSGGVTRRAAKMVCMDLDHPDIMQFIDCKTASEAAAAALVTGSGIIKTCCQGIMDIVTEMITRSDKPDRAYESIIASTTLQAAVTDALDAGVCANYIDKAIHLAMQGDTKWFGEEYDIDFEGKAYETVPYQNANHSVRIPFEFYKAVDAGTEWATRWRTDKKAIAASRPAREIELAIAKACWISGDPGVQYDDTINDWNVTPKDGRINASNPCSEHMRLDASACNLASNRLMKFYDTTGRFNCAQFFHVVRLWVMVLDITNCMAHLPDAETALNVYSYRDIGLGYCDLGAVIMANGLAYNSKEGCALAAMLTALLQAEAHRTSALLAKELGAYPRFAMNKAAHQRVVRNTINAMNGDGSVGVHVQPVRLNKTDLCKAVGAAEADKLLGAANEAFAEAYAMANLTGYRNAEMTLLAPTGTISIVMDCDTTGVEPLLGLRVKKQLVGGGNMQLAPVGSVPLALAKLGYTQAAIDQISKDIAETGKVSAAINKADLPVFATSLGGNAIPWGAHLNMMAAVQPFLSGAISKTINMDKSATIEDVRAAFRAGHELALKSVAIYRDHSKLSQPLTLDVAKLAETTHPTSNNVTVTPAVHLSPVTPAGGRMRLDYMRNSGIDVCVALGPGHLYLHTVRYQDGRCAEIWATYTADQGIIQAMLSSLCRTANVGLQWGVPLKDYIQCWNDCTFEPFGIVYNHPFIKTAKSLVNLMARLLDYHELGETNLLDTKPDEGSTTTAAETALVHRTESTRVQLTGERCPQCGSIDYVTTGTRCKKCRTCGHQGGCG